MDKNITIYSKIVSIKKRFFKKRIVPVKLAFLLDIFFNNLYNLPFILKDITRDSVVNLKDITRDSVVNLKDITRDSVVNLKDITRDSVVNLKDITRDSVVNLKDITRDSVVNLKDVTRDSVVNLKDITRDGVVNLKDITRDSVVNLKDITRDSVVNLKDVTRDGVVNLKDITRDSVVNLKDITRDSVVNLKDVTRDGVVNLKDVTRDSVVNLKDVTRDGGFKKWGRATEITLLKYITVFIFSIKAFFEIFYAIFTVKSITVQGDAEAMSEIDTMLVNSINVQKRVAKFYNRESRVIYPPISVNKFYNSADETSHEDYWLSVNRITPEKRVELQVTVFNKLNRKLIIVGGHEDHTYYKKIKEIAGPNIFFLESVNEVYLRQLYSETVGLITTAKDEDFGMTAVEAMASGKPVIAPNEGGYMESLVNEETGLLIDNIDEQKLLEAVEKIEAELKSNSSKYKDKCINQAKRFDTSIFIEKVTEELKLLYERKKTFHREKTAVAIFSFNRPNYLKQVLDSLVKNTDLKNLDFYLFQDGSVNKFSGRIAAKDSDIKKCVSIWNKCSLPNKRLIQNYFNLSIAITQFNAKVLLFEEYRYEQVMFFEDDMVLSKNYIRLLKVMLKQYQGDKEVSLVMCNGGPPLKRTDQDCLSLLGKVQTGIQHLWGWATWKDRWELIKPDFLDYYEFVKDIDYRNRDTNNIINFFKEQECSLKGTSQDGGIEYACYKNKLYKINTCVHRGKYIGASGEHMNDYMFKEGGYLRTNKYDFEEDCSLEKFDEYDKETFKKHTVKAMYRQKKADLS